MVGFIDPDKFDEVFAHINRAREALDRMNIGNAHDELDAILRTETKCFTVTDMMPMPIACTLTEAGAEALNEFNTERRKIYPMCTDRTDYKDGDIYYSKIDEIISPTHIFAEIGVGRCIKGINLHNIV